jgi:hypothetical protein
MMWDMDVWTKWTLEWFEIFQVVHFNNFVTKQPSTFHHIQVKNSASTWCYTRPEIRAVQ